MGAAILFLKKCRHSVLLWHSAHPTPTNFNLCSVSFRMKNTNTGRAVSQHSFTPELIIPLFCSSTHRPRIMTAIVVWERKKEKKKIDIVMTAIWMVYFMAELLEEQEVSFCIELWQWRWWRQRRRNSPFVSSSLVPSLLQAVVAAFFEPTLLSVLTMILSTSSRIDDNEKKAVAWRNTRFFILVLDNQGNVLIG